MHAGVSVAELPSVPGRYATAILDLFFPRTCVGCGRRGELLCPDCIRQLAPLGSSCPRCGKPQAEDSVCARCWSRTSPIDGIKSAYRFQGSARTVIHAFKYSGLRALARPVAQLLAEHLADKPIPGSVLVAVPLHPLRLRERGYNQSLLLARELGRLIGMPVVDNALIRLKNTLPQVRTQDAETRLANVQGAFTCRGEQLKAVNAIILDDVCTSGATLEACAEAMKSAGAAYVFGLTFAREI
jgi:ComF family protein